MIANMGKGEHISMKTLLRICGALHCDIADVIAWSRTTIMLPHEGPPPAGTLCPKVGTEEGGRRKECEP